MNKENISILVISNDSDIISLVENFAENILHSDLSLSVCGHDCKDIQKLISSEYIDLVVYDLIDLDSMTFKTANLLLSNAISILFLIEDENVNTLINSDLDFHLVDFLRKPVLKGILEHKVEVYLKNILQKKASEYLLRAYDESVIASKTNLKGIITYTSQAFCDISEYTKEELLGKAHNIVRHPDTPPEVYKGLWDTIKAGNQWRGEIKNIKKNGGFYWVRVTVSPEFNYNGEIIGYNSIRQDISPQKYIEQVSLIDHLTQVYNKKYYDEVMKKEVDSASRYEYVLSLLMVDIDHFKDVNDTYGHLIGDKVLQQFANVLIENTRKSDIVSRIGGEEFAIIISNDTMESACAFAEKLRKSIASHQFEVVNNVTASIGISSYIKGDTVETLFKRVDDAMYEAKHNGRDCVVRV